ncbi:hypothetical protein TrRE_jg7621 [Triparma retinervis]|uniref:Protein kinase domain-containing protein n=1 Tax=Triparma retinervis TaxID=2557542 RepID=A0A9W6ZNK4_9STRA|nr:hypothetical protein TrRE_jg7621 [Triparma retinervis]
MLESISQVAAAHVLDRTAEMRASLAKKSFGREATDTSFGSSSSADKDVDLASLLPPPRISLSIDVDVVNDDSEEASLPLGDDTPKGKGGKTRSNSSSGKMHLVDFHDGSMKETWVISNEGAMRLDEYNPKEEYMEMLRGKAFRSNHVVSFYDAYSTEDGFAHVVMEYMNGGSIQDMIDKGGSQNEDVLRNIARGIAEGLKELHENKFLHRDLKPANVLMGTDGSVKVADFGVSKDLASSKDLAKTFIGTFLYMSPERIAGEDYDQAADIWGLGMTILASFLGRDRPSTASLLEHRFLATGDGKSPMPQASSTDHIEKAKKAELLAVVTTCKEHGVTFPRKTTSFRVIAAQVGVTESYCEEVFCPRKSKQQRQTPTRRKSSAANINKVGILAKEGLMTTKETLIKSSPTRALKKAFSTKGEKSFGGGREEEEPIVLGG